MSDYNLFDIIFSSYITYMKIRFIVLYKVVKYLRMIRKLKLDYEVEFFFVEQNSKPFCLIC